MPRNPVVMTIEVPIRQKALDEMILSAMECWSLDGYNDQSLASYPATGFKNPMAMLKAMRSNDQLKKLISERVLSELRENDRPTDISDLPIFEKTSAALCDAIEKNREAYEREQAKQRRVFVAGKSNDVQRAVELLRSNGWVVSKPASR